MSKKKSEFPEEEKVEEVWDIRKIIAGIVILLLLIIGGVFAKKLFFHESLDPASFIPQFPSVKGVNTSPDDQTKVTHVKISLPSQQDVQNQIQTLQTQVTHLNLQEIATSSPQVQQVLKQIENLPNQGSSQVKDACIRLCSNL